MKAFLSLTVLLVVTSGIVFGLQSDKEEVCIEDWYAQTSQLFQSASNFFSSSTGSASSAKEIEELDAKLQELLPTENIDFSYRSEETPTLISSLATDSQPGLLPDLFDQKNQPKTKFKGQVHTDDQDNIVGAEVNVSIPADIR